MDIMKIKLVREKAPEQYQDKITNLECVPKIIQDYIGDEAKEHLIVICLGTNHTITGLHTVSQGTLTKSICHPREVFKPAILNNAKSIILAHNHPSGDIEPSEGDEGITARIKEAGEILGIDLLDHIIVGFGTEEYYSFQAEGAL